MFKRNL